jgi:hypothetical protein
MSAWLWRTAGTRTFFEKRRSYRRHAVPVVICSADEGPSRPQFRVRSFSEKGCGSGRSELRSRSVGQFQTSQLLRARVAHGLSDPVPLQHPADLAPR